MELQDLVEEFRNQVADAAQPYLWSDDEVLRYIIDAQDQFCRKTGGISDMSTAAICNVTATLNTPFTAHSPYVLRIMNGRLQTSKRDIDFIQFSQINTLRERDYGQFNKFELDDADVGDVRWGVLGLEEKKIRWIRVPQTTEVVRLRVYRLPYPRLPVRTSLLQVTDVLEIDEMHHIHLIMWMKHMAYSKQDAEARDDKKALDNEMAFNKYCDTARNEIDRRRYKPRQVQYGG